MELPSLFSTGAMTRDEVKWMSSANQQYTASSAYSLQFGGEAPDFDTTKLWDAKAEPKVKLFAWTAMYEKAPTADNLEKKGWDNNVICPLCLHEAESNYHHLIDCNFVQGVLKLLLHWMDYPQIETDPATPETVAARLIRISGLILTDTRREGTRIILYAWWNVWKERNRRIFQGVAKTVDQVAFLAEEEISLFKMAFSSI